VDYLFIAGRKWDVYSAHYEMYRYWCSVQCGPWKMMCVFYYICIINGFHIYGQIRIMASYIRGRLFQNNK
jgi:hypothetical protein